MALTAFAIVTAISLSAWTQSTESLSTAHALIAGLSMCAAVASGVWIRRQPSREAALAGAGAIAFSFLRVGLPSTWTASTYVVIALTVLFLIPPVQAAMTLQSSME